MPCINSSGRRDPSRTIKDARTLLYLDDLSVGDTAEITREVAEGDLATFAAVTGDNNPIHLDEAWATTTPFGGRIAHGMLSAGYISAVIGTKLPGPGAIYVSQTLRFRRPVRIGDVVVTRVEITAIDLARARVTLSTECRVAGKSVVDGHAEILAPRKGV